jgi:hypothetical protein
MCSFNLWPQNSQDLFRKEINIHYEKIGWFATSLAIGFLSCNDHLQLIAIQHIFMNKCYWTSCTSCNKCNSLYVEPCAYTTCASHLQLCGNNYYASLMQLICNYHGNVMMTFINSSKSNTWHYGNFWVKLFSFWNLISTIHYD